jgi:ADP-ribosylglycohydrolase
MRSGRRHWIAVRGDVSSSRKAVRMPTASPSILFGHGMVSDDTDYTIFVAQALFRSDDNAARFRDTLAWRFRFWFACLPAGIG